MKICYPSTRREFFWRALAVMLTARHDSFAVAAVKSNAKAPSRRIISLDLGWRYAEGGNGGESWMAADLPHCATRLSWQNWDCAAWQKLWTYRRKFTLPPETLVERAFLRFDGVVQKASPAINGTKLEEHAGGFLPFEREVTGLLRTQNTLTVTADGRWLNVPPGGNPKGPASVDYLMPAGIPRNVSLHIRPHVFIADVFAKPVDCLESKRSVAVECTIDGKGQPARALAVRVELIDGERVLAQEQVNCVATEGGLYTAVLLLTRLGNIQLWSPDTPKLHTVRATLYEGGREIDSSSVRIGFREAQFEVDGFYLNGTRSKLFGLNRHELFPFAGFAMPERVIRRDAEILRRDLNCNAVRCSHYPQSEDFLNACDELGLMVWEEIPGWGYIGDDAWKALAMRDTEDMIRRGRNHPSIIIWGTRVNESHNDLDLYQQTNAIARKLDGTRPVSGSMTTLSTVNWFQDVFAYDDYHARSDGSVAMAAPVPGVPFMFSEAVGQFAYGHGGGFHQYYRRAGDRELFEQQALYHAQGHDRGVEDPRCAGVVAWCAFDYSSLMNSLHAVKTPGVMDVFRIPKFGAAFYHSQRDPNRPVIEPAFFWDAETVAKPLSKGYIYCNCESLRVTIGTQPPIHLEPERAAFPNLKYPPFCLDLPPSIEGNPELHIEGFIGGRVVLTRRFSPDRSYDSLVAQADDECIDADGKDATRVWFRAVDRYGAPAPCLDGIVSVEIIGDASLIGDQTFDMSETGGVGAVWIRSKLDKPDNIVVRFSHARLGERKVVVRSAAPSSRTPIGRMRAR